MQKQERLAHPPTEDGRRPKRAEKKETKKEKGQQTIQKYSAPEKLAHGPPLGPLHSPIPPVDEVDFFENADVEAKKVGRGKKDPGQD